MDTVTQLVLGAAVGEATLGRKVGNKAPLWGALGGLIPDLDMLAYPVLDPVARMAFHRGVSHSLLFALIFAPIFGYIICRIYREKEASWWHWSILVFWSVVTHPLLDIFTTYGTQFFWPFSKMRISLNSVFVIDPIYSLPFALSVILLLFFKRASKTRKILNYSGLLLSTLYLLFTFVNKQYINDVFSKNLLRQKVNFSRLHSTPTPFNNFLWRGLAETEDGYFEGYYSWFDEDKSIEFNFIPKNHYLISSLKNKKSIQTLKWISNGFYTITKDNQALYFNDMRYGQINGWLRSDGGFIFSFRIKESDPNKNNLISITRERASFTMDKVLLLTFFHRILGKI